MCATLYSFPVAVLLKPFGCFLYLPFPVLLPLERFVFQGLLYLETAFWGFHIGVGPACRNRIRGVHVGVGPACGFSRLGLERVLGFPLQPRGLGPHKKRYRLLLCTTRAVSVSSWCCWYGFGTGVVAGSPPSVAGALCRLWHSCPSLFCRTGNFASIVRFLLVLEHATVQTFSWLDSLAGGARAIIIGRRCPQ